MLRKNIVIGLIFLLALPAMSEQTFSNYKQYSLTKTSYKLDKIAQGFNYPWALTFLDKKNLLISEKNGGLFIRTTEQLALGTEVSLIVTLPDSLESSQVKGTVSWITPVGAQNGTPAGIGVSFVEDPDNIRNQIDKSIGRLLNSPEPTLSM